ncbi:MAG: conserved protein of unknown function [Nitrospira sp.]
MIVRAGTTVDLLKIGTCFTVMLVSAWPAGALPAGAAQVPAVLVTQAESDAAQNDEKPRSLWRYGLYLDLSYAIDFNFPENHQWRSKVTTQRVNDPNLNMALAYVRKDANESSRWGMEFALQTGRDVDGEVPNASNRFGDPYEPADTFSHFSRANVSYLAPIGTGLTLTAGLFNSFIGYESFYAKNNFNYTRAYVSDYAPYFMFGASAQYRFSETVKTAFYIINRYNFLSYPNNLPGYGTQVSWAASPELTFTQNLYYGPDQSNTQLKYWRFFSDSILEWKRGDVTIAMAYDIGTERAIPEAGEEQELWTGGAIWTRWQMARLWAVAVRPELYYDPNGILTGAKQFIKAVTTTLEYKWEYAWTTTIFRLEYRFDNSTGPQGGFYTGGQIAPGVIGLTPSQNLLFFSALWSFDSR